MGASSCPRLSILHRAPSLAGQSEKDTDPPFTSADNTASLFPNERLAIGRTTGCGTVYLCHSWGGLVAGFFIKYLCRTGRLDVYRDFQTQTSGARQEEGELWTESARQLHRCKRAGITDARRGQNEPPRFDQTAVPKKTCPAPVRSLNAVCWLKTKQPSPRGKREC